jgi:hypothetical protein
MMLEQEHWHRGITLEVVMDAVERQMYSPDNPGFCLICGEETDGCEPDAEYYNCDSCGSDHVFGAEAIFTSMDW